MGFFVESIHRFVRYARAGFPGMLLIVILAATVARGQPGPLATPLDSKTPIQITADSLEADNRNRTFLFKGNVKVVQGTTEMTSEQLKVWYRNDDPSQEPSQDGPARIRDIEASGNVVILFDGRTAKSDQARYSADEGTLTLLGENATIIDGKNTILGSKITLYRNEDRITVEGNRTGRVEAVIFPGSTDPGN